MDLHISITVRSMSHRLVVGTLTQRMQCYGRSKLLIRWVSSSHGAPEKQFLQHEWLLEYSKYDRKQKLRDHLKSFTILWYIDGKLWRC